MPMSKGCGKKRLWFWVFRKKWFAGVPTWPLPARMPPRPFQRRWRFWKKYKMKTDIALFCVGRDCSIQQAIARMCENKMGIVLVVDEKNHLMGTVTDGDISRAILANISLSET